MKALLFFIVISFFSCHHMTNRYVCTCQQRKKAQEFVEKNIKPSNNMSDEEMEDVISELYRTGVKLNCELKYIETDSNFNPITPLDSCQFYMEKVY